MTPTELPDAVFNHTLRDDAGLRVGIPDAYLPSVGVAVQVHSRRYHDGWDREGNDLWSHTVQRDNAYTAVGIAVIGVTPTALRDTSGTFLAQLAQTVAQRAGMPLPGVTLECPDGCDSIDTHALLASHSSHE